LLGSNWQSAVIYVQLSAIFVPVEMLASVAATACSALGAISMQIRLQTFLLSLLIPIMLYFSFQHQLLYILMALAAYYWLRFFMYILILSIKLKIKLLIQLNIIFSQWLASFWIGVLIFIASHHLSQLTAFQLLPIQVAVGGFGLFTFIIFGPAKQCRRVIRDFLYLRKTNNKLIKLSKFLLKKEY